MSAFAEWTSINKIDDFTDKTVRYAVYTDDSHKIQVSHQGSDVWIFITRKKIGSFEPNTIIELRVDQNKTNEINPIILKKLEAIGKKAYQWEPNTVGFLIWHGNENEGCGFIEQLISGQLLKGRYKVNTMETDSFSISLTGARESIINGLDLKICGK